MYNTVNNKINQLVGITKPLNKNTMKTTMKLTKESYTLKETDRIKEEVNLWFDEDENVKFTVRLLNGNITSIQNHLSKWLSNDEIKEFKKQYYSN